MAAAAAIAAAPQLAVKRIKQNLNDADRVTFPEALDGEAERHARTAMHLTHSRLATRLWKSASQILRVWASKKSGV